MSKLDKVLATLKSKDNANKQENLEEVEEVITSLTKRRVKLRDWIEKAWVYYNGGKPLSFAALLESALTRGSKSYVDYKDDLLRSHMLLLGYYVRLCCVEPSNQRAMWREKVTSLLQAADGMQANVCELQHTLSRGFAHILLDERLQEADSCFVNVLRQVPHDVNALLGRGCLAYNRQDYHMALGYFKDILLHHPEGPLDVRVAIGHCFLKLGNLTSARAAFDLAFEHNKGSVNAILGIVQLQFNERTQNTNIEAINKLCTAFQLNQRHPIVLTWLSSYLFYAGDYDTLNSIAGNAYASTENEELKSQNCFQIARSFHALKNYDRAFDFYGMAIAHFSGYAPPHMGVAQMYIRRGQLDKAENSLRNLLKALPNQTQALRMLGMLFYQSDVDSKRDMAVQLFTKAARDKHYESFLGLAATYERKQCWQEALDAYEQAVRIYLTMHGHTHDLPLTWLNNMAALQLQTGNAKAALQILDKALSMTPDASNEHYENNLLTLRYNRARVLEELNLLDQAESSYEQLIVEYPGYYDCYLRLGTMAYKRNQPKAALERFQAVLQLDSQHEAANIYMGNTLVREGDEEQAMSKYNVVMQRKRNVEDSYMLVAMGNVGLINLQRAIEDGDQEMTKLQMQNALQLFRKALEKNPRNLWAANGIGAVLSTHGYLAEGETIFKQIAESSKRCPDALLNSANASLQLEHFPEAVEAYKLYLSNSPFVKCVQVLQSLAKSLYHVGRLKEAKESLLKALHITPQDPTLYYNLAIVMRQDGCSTFERNTSNLEDLKNAEFDIKLAQGFFNFVIGKGKFLDTASNEANVCSQLLDKAPAELKAWHLQEEQKMLELQKQQELEKSKELFCKPMEREQSTKRKRDREPSTRRKKSSKRESSVKPMTSERESSVKPSTSEREASVMTRSMEREPSVKPRTTEREASVKPRTTEREASVQPKPMEREASVKTRAMERSCSVRPPAVKPTLLETAAVKEEFAMPAVLEREASVKPRGMEREASVKTRAMERSCSVRPPPMKPTPLETAAVKEEFAMPKGVEREASVKPKATEREPSVKAKGFSSYTIPKLSDRESSTKPKAEEREPSVKPKPPDQPPIEAAALGKKEPEKLEAKISPKGEEKKDDTDSPDAKNSKKKAKKRKHKSKKKKGSDSRESSAEPKDKEKKK